jgi:hypothetical protein
MLLFAYSYSKNEGYVLLKHRLTSYPKRGVTSQTSKRLVPQYASETCSSANTLARAGKVNEGSAAHVRVPPAHNGSRDNTFSAAARAGLGTQLLLNIRQPQEDDDLKCCTAVPSPSSHHTSSSGSALRLDAVRDPISRTYCMRTTSWDVTPCAPVEIHLRSEGTNRLHLQDGRVSQVITTERDV